MKNTSTQIIKSSISAKAKAKCEEIIKRLPVPQCAIKWLARAKTKEDLEDLADVLALEYDVQMGLVAMDWLQRVARSCTRGEESVYAKFLLEQTLEMMEERDKRRRLRHDKRHRLRQLKANARSQHAKRGTLEDHTDCP